MPPAPAGGIFVSIFKEKYMKLIEYRGEVLSGYVPELPETTERCGETLRLICLLYFLSY